MNGIPKVFGGNGTRTAKRENNNDQPSALQERRGEVIRLSHELLTIEEQIARLRHELAQAQESHRWTLTAHRATVIELRNAELLVLGENS